MEIKLPSHSGDERRKKLCFAASFLFLFRAVCGGRKITDNDSKNILARVFSCKMLYKVQKGSFFELINEYPEIAAFIPIIFLRKSIFEKDLFFRCNIRKF